MTLSCSKKTISVIRGPWLLRWITSKHSVIFIVWIAFILLEQKTRLNRTKSMWKKKCLWSQKSDKAPFDIYADLECLIEKIDGCKNSPENSSTAKLSEHIPSGFSMSTISSFRSIENKHDVYRGKDCMKKFCESLREHAMKIINFRNKKNEVVNKEKNSRNHMTMQKSVIFVYKNLKINIWKITNIVKLEIIVIIQENL